MPKHTIQIQLGLDRSGAMRAILNGATSLGLNVLEQDPNRVLLKESFAFDENHWHWPAKITAYLSPHNSGTVVKMDGKETWSLVSAMRGRLKRFMQTLHNRIRLCAEEISANTPQSVGSGSSKIADDLSRLASLFAEGLLSRSEYEAAKSRVLKS